MFMFNIEEELKNLPDSPGVYIMHDSGDNVIYVGKAKVLKNRVRQYFQNSANHTPKVRAMVSHIAWFEYIMTDSEVEALVLECNLIKKYRPKYNILLKDDKQYPYIKVTINEPYPRIMMERKLKNDGAKYFGPYMGTNTIKNTLDIVQKIFKPPSCNRKFPQDIGKGRPCLNYHIKNCFAPCVGGVSREEYRRIFFDICSFLDGDHKGLLEALTEQMTAASKALEFEKAAALRDKIQSVRAIEEKQKIVNVDKQTDEDILACSIGDNSSFCEVFFVRSGKVVGRENYRIENTSELTKEQVLGGFVKQFYDSAMYIPKTLLLECDIEDRELIAGWLTQKAGHKVTLSIPVRGEKRRMTEMVQKNADTANENDRIRRLKNAEENHTPEALAAALNLSQTPVRIESYDISNVSGADNVASMVVFERGRAANSKYRKFKIKSFEGADDYRAMREVIYRRFRHALEEEEKIAAGQMKPEEAKFLPYPDLILLDGGVGHLNAVSELLESIEVEVPVFGMVKDDKHRTRGLVSKDGEIDLPMTGSVFRFITRIQDEVHRVAISYHRSLHRKNAVISELDKIPGIGSARRKKLLKEFGSVARIKKASLEELEKSCGKKTGTSVYEYFHKEQE